MAMVARRTVSLGGRTYQAGDPVTTRGLSSDKIQQLIAQRVLVDTRRHAPESCVALRDLAIAGRTYARGEFVDVRRLAPDKLSQLLEHRMLDLLPAAGAMP